MIDRGKPMSIETILMHQWVGHSIPPVGLLEQQCVEMENMGPGG